MKATIRQYFARNLLFTSERLPYNILIILKLRGHIKNAGNVKILNFL